jgi:hypothetical protein
MSIQNQYQSAFPVQYPFHSEGMTLRDYFAGQALTGIISACMALDDSRAVYEAMSNDAYYFADAMMEARKKFGEVPEVTS